MKLKISEGANKNYLAKIIKLKDLRKHSNADKLQVVTVDFQNVITGMDAKEGDIYVYFPLECAINKDFLAHTNSFSNAEMNKDKDVKGFFDKNGRVRAVKLRGEPSQGYIIPLEVLLNWVGSKSDEVLHMSPDLINKEFDTISDIEICKKYVPHITRSSTPGKQKSRIPRISRLVENQFRLHNDTENLRKNIDRISPDDYIGIHYKKHGTSFVVGNVLAKKKLNFWTKLALKLGLSVQTEEYDIFYSSRRIVKNEYETQDSQHYYKSDIWGEVKEELKNKIPKSYTCYGEILGYTKEGMAIQRDFDYGCKYNEHKIYIYRITITNPDGFAIELDDMQIKEFCDKYELNYSDTFFWYGQAMDLYIELLVGGYIKNGVTIDDEQWRATFIEGLEKKYNDKNCYMCINKVPEEGIVLRKQGLFQYEAYKLKSSKFLEKETKDLDENVVDMETQEGGELINVV